MVEKELWGKWGLGGVDGAEQWLGRKERSIKHPAVACPHMFASSTLSFLVLWPWFLALFPAVLAGL